MRLSPLLRLVIHTIAVLTISYRLVNCVETSLLADLQGVDDANENTTEATTDDYTPDNSSDPIITTTDFNISSSESPGNLTCILSKNGCTLEGTNDECDPCDGVECNGDQFCLSDNSTCTTTCECSDELKVKNEQGICINPCDPSPCKNNQPCLLNASLPSKFRCNCNSDYEGTYCETEHNYCHDEHPAKCPSGARECYFYGPGNYTCTCTDGHTLNEEANTCTKVTQKLSVDLIFQDIYYGEIYNVQGTTNRTYALSTIEAAMRDLYGDLLISIAFTNFTQGSLVAHYSMSMRMAADGNPEQNVWSLMTYITGCETNNAAKRACFKDLGKPHLPINGTKAEDLRCQDVHCPEGTECMPIDQSESSVRCACKSGYSLQKTVVEDTGRQIDICEDIDECSLTPKVCKADELCVNSPGSYTCYGNPCDKNPCPGNAVCKAVDHYTYDCECEWIYIASDCGTPWPLILVIISSVLLVLLIIAIIGNIILFSRSRKGEPIDNSFHSSATYKATETTSF